MKKLSIQQSIDEKLGTPVKGMHPILFKSRCNDLYISKEKNGKQYCALSDDLCPYFKLVKNHEYCTNYKR